MDEPVINDEKASLLPYHCFDPVAEEYDQSRFLPATIRKQAATTLLALGAPGTILLQANAPGVGPAAEMAVHSLQLHSLSTQEEAA